MEKHKGNKRQRVPRLSVEGVGVCRYIRGGKDIGRIVMCACGYNFEE